MGPLGSVGALNWSCPYCGPFCHCGLAYEVRSAIARIERVREIERIGDRLRQVARELERDLELKRFRQECLVDHKARWFREALEWARYLALRARPVRPPAAPLPRRGRAAALSSAWRASA